MSLTRFPRHSDALPPRIRRQYRQAPALHFGTPSPQSCDFSQDTGQFSRRPLRTEGSPLTQIGATFCSVAEGGRMTAGELGSKGVVWDALRQQPFCRSSFQASSSLLLRKLSRPRRPLPRILQTGGIPRLWRPIARRTWRQLHNGSSPTYAWRRILLWHCLPAPMPPPTSTVNIRSPGIPTSRLCRSALRRILPAIW